MNQPEPSNSGIILVTGANGMLGSHIVEILLRQQYHVRGLILPGSQTNTLEGLPVELHYGDIRHPEDCAAAMQGCEMVIHTAASTSTWPTRSAVLHAVNFTGTQNMVLAAKNAGIRRFVHISSASCFGPGISGCPATEDTPFRGFQFRLDYIDSKYRAHQYVLDAARTQGFPAIVLCPTLMIGPNDINLGSGQMIVAASKQKLHFLSRGGKNFVYVRDVAQAAVNALKQGRPGEAYITGHSNLSYRQFFDFAGKIVGAPPPRWLLPGWVILAVGMISSVLATLFRFRPLLNYSQALISLESQYFTSDKAIWELNMPQTDISVAIEAAFAWLKRERYC